MKNETTTYRITGRSKTYDVMMNAIAVAKKIDGANVKNFAHGPNATFCFDIVYDGIRHAPAIMINVDLAILSLNAYGTTFSAVEINDLTEIR